MQVPSPRTTLLQSLGPLSSTVQAPIRAPEPKSPPFQNQSSISRQLASAKYAPPLAPEPGPMTSTSPIPSGSQRGTWSFMTEKRVVCGTVLRGKPKGQLGSAPFGLGAGERTAVG